MRPLVRSNNPLPVSSGPTFNRLSDVFDRMWSGTDMLARGEYGQG